VPSPTLGEARRLKVRTQCQILWADDRDAVSPLQISITLPRDTASPSLAWSRSFFVREDMVGLDELWTSWSKEIPSDAGFHLPYKRKTILMIGYPC